MMAEPPLDAGTENESVTLPSPGVPDTAVGALGTVMLLPDRSFNAYIPARSHVADGNRIVPIQPLPEDPVVPYGNTRVLATVNLF
jgi:hypothetical protein